MVATTTNINKLLQFSPAQSTPALQARNSIQDMSKFWLDIAQWPASIQWKTGVKRGLADCNTLGVCPLMIVIQSNLHVRPPLVSDHLPYATANPKHQNVPSQSLTGGTSCKLPPLSDRDHFLGLMVHDFPFFLTSCKWSLDSFFDLYVLPEVMSPGIRIMSPEMFSQVAWNAEFSLVSSDRRL